MDQETRRLYDLLAAQLDEDPAADEDLRRVVLAAVTGPDELSAVLAGTPHTPPVTDAGDAPAGRGPEVYLAAIGVEGFRGVGPRETLPLRPGPGLTLVTGRNGSGKSSFAEAAELALTGDSARWAPPRSRVWRSGWRNLHAGDGDVAIRVDLVAAGTSGTVRIERSWSPDAELTDARWTRTAPGTDGPVPFDGEPWRADLVTYRPFLSYSELGALMDGKPTELHDAVQNLLGLGALTDARDHVRRARKERADTVKQVSDARRTLHAELSEVDDPRAARAAALLRATAPALDEVAELARGGDDDPSGTAALTALAALDVPDPDVVAAAVHRLRTAADAVVARSGERTRSADRTAALLRTVLDEHPADGPCPVCEVGTLDERWRAAARRRATGLEQESASLRRATAELDAAVGEARALTRTRPSVVDTRGAPVELDGLAAAWSDWQAAGRAEGPSALAQALTTAVGPVLDQARDVGEQARAALAHRDGTWAPLARRLGAWHDAAAAARGHQDAVTLLTRAGKWLDGRADELRDDRMGPIAGRCRQVWRSLRQQSSVDLGPVRLAGRATQRHVTLDVRVDGAEGSTALGVMSQGELHALGLSLFLPRATMDHAPFRFVVIDDPVQAMDPSKVDGLAQVLGDVAADRQVVVFTHDDRLPEAVRRLQIPATVLEVRRAERSRVTVSPGDDPVARYLDDARAMALTSKLPPDLRGELVATCCRSALEAACQARVRAVRLGRGDRHADVEAAITEAHKTEQLMTLALFDDPSRGREVLPHVRDEYGRDAATALQNCRRGAHTGLSGDLRPFVRHVERLARWIHA